MGVAGIAILIVVIGALLASARSYLWVLKASQKFAQSVEYAVKGVATAVVGATFIAPFWMWGQASGSERSLILESIALLIGGYIALVALGYIGEQIWSVVVTRHEQATGNHPLSRFAESEGDTE